MKIEIQTIETGFGTDCLWRCRQNGQYHHQVMMSDSKLLRYHKLTRKHFGICWYPNFYYLQRRNDMKTLEYTGPRCDQAVDIVIFNSDKTQVLLGRKKHQPNFRFIGGFSSVDSDSLEEDAVREVLEETHLIVSNPMYVGSRKVDDPRYHGTIHAIKTCLFVTVGTIGTPKADDDIYEVGWFPVEQFRQMELMPEHTKLRDMLFERYEF